MADPKTLLMDLKVGESISIDGGRVVITLEEKSGQRIKLRCVHEGVPIDRRAKPRAEPDRRQGAGAAQARLGIKAAQV
jgi:hypothetical protein